MKTVDVFALGLGLKAPWQILGQSMNTSNYPFELTLEIGSPIMELLLSDFPQ